MSTPSTPASNADPELEALPKPRRPWRRVTLAVMVATTVSSVAVLWSLRGEITYSLDSGPPRDLGELSAFKGNAELANQWVRGKATLSAQHAASFSRPLDPDGYRIAQVSDNEKLWVQVRVPGELDAKAYVPPTSLVGRLLPLEGAGLRYAGLVNVAELALRADAGAAGDLSGMWLLVDGEAPRTTHWVFGVALLLLGFALFNTYGLVRLLGPPREH